MLITVLFFLHHNFPLLLFSHFHLRFSLQHTNEVMVIMSISAIILAVIPLKFILLATILNGFIMTSKLGKHMQNEPGNRRVREWWDSIPIVPVEIVDKVPDSST
jgi:hypothetical protein